jgi:hypothetical protein
LNIYGMNSVDVFACKDLMLNIFYIEKINRQKSYNLDSYGHSK